MEIPDNQQLEVARRASVIADLRNLPLTTDTEEQRATKRTYSYIKRSDLHSPPSALLEDELSFPSSFRSEAGSLPTGYQSAGFQIFTFGTPILGHDDSTSFSPSLGNQGQINLREMYGDDVVEIAEDGPNPLYDIDFNQFPHSVIHGVLGLDNYTIARIQGNPSVLEGMRQIPNFDIDRVVSVIWQRRWGTLNLAAEVFRNSTLRTVRPERIFGTPAPSIDVDYLHRKNVEMLINLAKADKRFLIIRRDGDDLRMGQSLDPDDLPDVEGMAKDIVESTEHNLLVVYSPLGIF
ncbi:MAG TPA: hypothetical protein ENI23_04705 [bacterium]|nr:hypothetical protein [bacterium]